MEIGTYYYDNEGHRLEIEYTYQSGEREVTYNPDGSGYPGSPPLIEIVNVWCALKDTRGHEIMVDIKDIVTLDPLNFEILEEQILESLE
tara:strand:- start:2213 stop:2479 length:267 start_codon:yes stop_codon:yes gene_type:complete